MGSRGKRQTRRVEAKRDNQVQMDEEGGKAGIPKRLKRRSSEARGVGLRRKVGWKRGRGRSTRLDLKAKGGGERRAIAIQTKESERVERRKR